MNSKSDLKVAEEKFIASLRESLDDAEGLLREAAQASGAKAAELREQAMQALSKTSAGLSEAQEGLIKQGCQAMKATDQYVHERPWQAAAVAGLVGVLIGVLITRR